MPAAAVAPFVPARSVDRKTDPQWRTAHARLLRSYLPLYATEVLRGPPEYGGRFLLGPHHIEWGDALAEERKILAIAARDHGKSFFWCLAYPLWMADRVAPGRVGYIISASSAQAEEHLLKIRQEIEGGGETGDGRPNPKLAHLLPFKKATARTLRLANGSEIRARGFGTRVRGGHPFWLVGDDMLNDEHIWSETIRTKGIDYFLSAIFPMLVPGGQMIIVGTPFHALDLYAHLEKTGTFRVMKHPALVNDEPLWPARHSLAALKVIRITVGSSIRWSREYLCQPISDEASLFPSYLFEAPGVKMPYRLGLPAAHWRARGFETYAGVDLALSASAGADHFVIFVIALDPKNGDRWVVDIILRKGLGYQEQIDLIISASRRYQCGLVFVESNQYQRVIPDSVVTVSDVPVKAFYTSGSRRKAVTTFRRGMNQTFSANRNALDQGIPALRMLLENGKIKIPWSPESRELVQKWIGEMQAFGWSDGKMQGVGAHDDTVLALWMADHAAKFGGDVFDGDDTGPDDVGDDEDGEDDVRGDNAWSVDFDDPDDEAEQEWRPDERVRFDGEAPHGVQSGWFGGR